MSNALSDGEHGVRFEVWSQRDGWCGQWETTKTTSRCVYFYRPDYDGSERYRRRFSWRQWWQLIVNGQLRFVGVDDARKKKIRTVAREALAKLDAAKQGDERKQAVAKDSAARSVDS